MTFEIAHLDREETRMNHHQEARKTVVRTGVLVPSARRYCISLPQVSGSWRASSFYHGELNNHSGDKRNESYKQNSGNNAETIRDHT
jgi:hypothetical protein